MIFSVRARRPILSVLSLCVALLALPGATPSVAAAPPAAGRATTDVTAAAGSTPGALAGHPVWVHFSNPPAHRGRDYTIINELERLIRAAPKGSTIRGTIYSLRIDSVADALLAAQRRGAHVQIVLDGKNAGVKDDSIATIKKLSQRRFCVGAQSRHACISTSRTADMHAKFFTFSKTRDPRGVTRSNVSWVTSSNLTYVTGPDAFNNAVTIYGDRGLTGGLNAYFADLWQQNHYANNDYYNPKSGRGYRNAASAGLYASPERKGQTDTAVARLNDLKPNSRCRVRIAMNFVTTGRSQLLKLVKKARADHCQVWMVVGSKKSGAIDMSRSVYDALLAAGVKIHRRDEVHDKFFLAYGKFGGSYRYQIYTGSQNWSRDALTDNDEIFLKLAPETAARHPLYAAYHAHFNAAYIGGFACTKRNFPCR